MISCKKLSKILYMFCIFSTYLRNEIETYFLNTLHCTSKIQKTSSNAMQIHGKISLVWNVESRIQKTNSNKPVHSLCTCNERYFSLQHFENKSTEKYWVFKRIFTFQYERIHLKHLHLSYAWSYIMMQSWPCVSKKNDIISQQKI